MRSGLRLLVMTDAAGGRGPAEARGGTANSVAQAAVGAAPPTECELPRHAPPPRAAATTILSFTARQFTTPLRASRAAEERAWLAAHGAAAGEGGGSSSTAVESVARQRLLGKAAQLAGVGDMVSAASAARAAGAGVPV